MTILKSFSKTLKTFCADASGQIALGFGLAALPMLAATGVGWFADAHKASASMCAATVDSVEPDGRLIGPYARLNSIYRDYYRTIQPIQAALGALLL